MIEYFLHDRFNSKIQIGRDRAAHWYFELYVYPPFMHTLEQWLPKLKNPIYTIQDQFGCTYMPDHLINIITQRGSKEPNTNFDYEKHNAELGINNLIRQVAVLHYYKEHAGKCVGHSTVWSYILQL